MFVKTIDAIKMSSSQWGGFPPPGYDPNRPPMDVVPPTNEPWDVASFHEVLLTLEAAMLSDDHGGAATQGTASTSLPAHPQGREEDAPSQPVPTSASSSSPPPTEDAGNVMMVDVRKDGVAVPKGDYAVDHLQVAMLSPLVRGADVDARNLFPIKLETEFKKKYYRFDNKVLQCFPNCSRFPDVREARMLGYDHRCGRAQAWCSNPIRAVATDIPLDVPADSLRAVGRFLSATPEVSVLPESDADVLQVGEIVKRLPVANCTQGRVVASSSNGPQQVVFELLPHESWVFNLTLPRHRRNAACAAHKVPLFVFEVLVFRQTSMGELQVCARSVTLPFEVASIRTLIREVLAFKHKSGGAVGAGEDEDMGGEEEERPSASTPLGSSSATSSPAPATTAMASGRPTRKHTRTNYSSAVHRIRLAAEALQHDKTKKMDIVVVPDESTVGTATGASAAPLQTTSVPSITPSSSSLSFMPQQQQTAYSHQPYAYPYAAPPPQTMFQQYQQQQREHHYSAAPPPVNQHQSSPLPLDMFADPPSWMDLAFELPSMPPNVPQTTTTQQPFDFSLPSHVAPTNNSLFFGGNNNEGDDDDDLIP